MGRGRPAGKRGERGGVWGRRAAGERRSGAEASEATRGEEEKSRESKVETGGVSFVTCAVSKEMGTISEVRCE